MVFKYRRKTNQASWTEEILKRALKSINEDGMSIRRASSQYAIPFTTLHRHANKNKSEKTLGRFRPAFSPEMEAELVKHLQDRNGLYLGLTVSELGSSAYEIAKRYKVHDKFKGGTAGSYWIQSFLKRHPEIVLRAPEPTNFYGTVGIECVDESTFLKSLTEIVQKYKLESMDMFNMNVSGFVIDRSSLDLKLINWQSDINEMDLLFSTVTCCSAAGHFIPPALIHSDEKNHIKISQPGSVKFRSDSGWICSDLFLKWLKLFVERVRPNVDHKVLLILDNQDSFVSLEATEFATSKGVVMLSVPPGESQKLQPMNQIMHELVKRNFETAVCEWRKKSGCEISTKIASMLFGLVSMKCCNIESAVNGFKSCGIKSYDEEVLQDNELDSTETGLEMFKTDLNCLEELLKPCEIAKTVDKDMASISQTVSPVKMNFNDNLQNSDFEPSISILTASKKCRVNLDLTETEKIEQEKGSQSQVSSESEPHFCYLIRAKPNAESDEEECILGT